MTLQISVLIILVLGVLYGPLSSSTYEPFRARVAVDYGPRLVGVASSDPFGNTVPICTLPNTGDIVYLCSQILDVARTRGALEVIVGLPLDSNGKMSYNVKNFNGQLCLNFSMVLAATTTVALPRASVFLFDERYTTREAKARIKTEKIKASIDAMSAVCLLERYLEDQGEGSLPAIACSYPPPRELMFFNYNIVRDHIRETYFSRPLSAEQKRVQIMQNLKEGKRASYNMGPAASKSSVEEVVEVKEADGRAPVRKTLGGKIVGYTGMDPPTAFSSILQSDTDGQEGEQGNEGEGEEGMLVEEVVMSVADLEMLEYEKIKAQRRKRGTLKKNHKPPPAAPIVAETLDE